MKKLFFVIIAVALLVAPGVAFAGAAAVSSGAGGSGMGMVKTYTTVNTSGVYTNTTIPVTDIIPGKCQILGYSINIIGANPDGQAALYDAISTTSLIDSYMLSENEATTTLAAFVIYPGQGIEISRGITVLQGGKTAVTVYYIQTRP
ncbi:MAG: hypothetical protein WC810_03025 [Janthinobacterium sp.]|jgi:hypothetical protein